MFVENFMKMIERLYRENVNITLDNIQQILVIISNDRKEKKRFLKKEI